MSENNKKYFKLYLLLAIILFLSIVFSVSIGSSNVNFMDALKVIGVKLFNIPSLAEYQSGPIHDVVYMIRLPRTILALLVGMSLALCGVIMQAVVKNPLADPYIMGISSGATLGATLGIILGIGKIFGDNFIGVMAFLGSLLIAILVLFISNIGGRSNTVKLILAGTALSSFCSAFTSLIIYLGRDRNGMQTVSYWLMGSLGAAKWSRISVLFPIVIISLIFFMTQFRNLNLMLLGDETSITLGTDLSSLRKIYILIITFLIGFVVYNAGIVGFVGLVIPHIVRIIVGTDHKKVVISSSLVGAIFLIWCDILSRVLIKNAELPIGIITAVLGSPLFVYLIIKREYGRK